ncbi:ankyrin repeat domain-containing protein [Silvimonas sp.]|uniref:ankyrin repeat domain-containing protein n=1 Tax=Silvimonas sp. TaxID=2650811 RepID=UPI00283EA190|nr:ankyrin repeat domain-containing protein [Silvimonas sp.]MDR3428201.1 ankyrin repeat domain-containing protein [Silvimonas sp.]
MLPLHEAAFYGDAARVKTLLEQGADPNAANEFGNTALHYAAYCDHEDIEKMLVLAGASTTCKAGDGISAAQMHYPNALNRGAWYEQIRLKQQTTTMPEVKPVTGLPGASMQVADHI